MIFFTRFINTLSPIFPGHYFTRWIETSLIILCFGCNHSYAIESSEVRIRAGLDLFTSILAADMDIAEKKNSDGKLHLILIYTNRKHKAEEMAEYLGKVGQIRGIPIRIKISDSRSFTQSANYVPAGIFLTQPLNNELNAILKYGQKQHIIVFSPFEGDVERGVLGGIHISDRLLPYLNMPALQSSNIRIKSFFLRVSVRYGK